MKNKVQLITYVDRLASEGMEALHDLLQGPFKGLFGAVHILPFYYPINGADAGFDPIDHQKVDPVLGDWEDVKRLGNQMELMADLIVNHMSSSSEQFQDFLKKGEQSAYKDLFLTMDSVFPEGATEQDLLSIYRPRPGFPFTAVTLADGQKRLMWTTFSGGQIDIDVKSKAGKAYLHSIIETLNRNGITLVRLDAAGYAVKKPGTSCFMIPETFDFIDQLKAFASPKGMEILVEIHSYYQLQIDIAKKVDWVYDFALPPLILHALFNHTSHYLKEWFEISPRNAITVLDTHDGIGIIDIGTDQAMPNERPGLVPDEELNALVETIHRNSHGQSKLATGAAASNLDLYQVNCTFYDALGQDDQAYLIARAIQFFAPGIPQIYYVGLLAGSNDMDLLHETGVGRDINRHYYSNAEIENQIKRPVVQELFELIRFRNQHPAFDGGFCVLDEEDDQILDLQWQNEDAWARLKVDLKTNSYQITHS